MRAGDGAAPGGGASDSGGLSGHAAPGGGAAPNGPASGGRAVPGGHVFFPGDDRLEGILEWPDAGPLVGGVVVAHPYPPHGATMAQPVVHRMARACRQRGIASLRFNFRSVEGSLGTFSGTEEHRDVLAATAFLRQRLIQTASEAPAPASAGRPDPAELPLALAGYSFGSAMAARAVTEAGSVQALVLVGFPVTWEFLPPDTFSRLEEYRGPVFALCAEQDEVGSPRDVERVLSTLGLDYTLEVVERTGHFLEGRHREAGERVAAFLGKIFDGRGRSREGHLGIDPATRG